VSIRDKRRLLVSERAQQGDTTTVAPHAGAEREHASAQRAPEAEESVVLEELLVEDVSIDGMCGVY
jgi:mycofactocin precursor